MKIIIETIPHEKQMYDTCGDWRYKDGDLYIYVSDQGDWRKDSLISIHEMVEAMLCKDRDISEYKINWQRYEKGLD